jgi:hypothetical protein
MTKIPPQLVDPRQPTLIAKSIHGLQRAAGTNLRRARGRSQRLAAAMRLLRCHLQVEPQLVFQIVIAPAAAQRPENTMNPLADERHGSAPFRLRRAGGPA